MTTHTSTSIPGTDAPALGYGRDRTRHPAAKTATLARRALRQTKAETARRFGGTPC